MEMSVLIGIYSISIPLCFFANKFAHKKLQSSIIPILWVLPVFNTLAFFILVLGILLYYMDKGFLSSEYWKQRWNS